MNVYGVSSGAYSDYEVVAIFETQEDAERYVTEMNSDATSSYAELRVEPFPFYPAGQAPTTTIYWQATAWSEDPDVAVKEARTDQDTSHLKRPKVDTFERRDGTAYFEARCLDREAAIKSVADRQAQWKATH